MPSFRMQLKGDVTEGIDRMEAQVRASVLVPGAAAMARVFYHEARAQAAKHTKSGALHDAIYRVYDKGDSAAYDQAIYRISWNHRKAPHGHLIEFGTSRAPAYPFIRPAFDLVDDAIKAGLARMTERFTEAVGGAK